MVQTSFVALLCTFSIATMSFLYRGIHTVAALSGCGRTMDLCKFRNMSLSIYVNALNMSPRFRLALLILLLMCSLKFNDLSDDTKIFFTGNQLFLTRFHSICGWMLSSTNMQIFTFLF